VELLRQITPEFRVAPSYETELTDRRMSPRRLCEVNAQRKAFAVAAQYPNHLVLGADTLVFLDDAALGKPADLNEARTMLGRLAGRIHEVVTGVCLVHRDANRAKMFSEVTRVKFRPLSETDIAAYLGRVDPLDKAGAYAIQEEASLIVEQVEGSHSNVVGLPVERVRAALETW
jgi:septum formation protein